MNDFNQIISRKETNSVKWDSIEKTYQEQDLLPLWVADMDFRAPQKVLDKLQDVISEGILGYTEPSDSLYDSIIEWHGKRYGTELTKKNILFSSGVVPSIVLCIQALTKPGDAIMIHDPVYHPFGRSVTTNDRKLIRSTLVEKEGHYTMDLPAMEEQIKKEKVKMLIFCNPQNPGGRVWSLEELQALGELCKKHQVLVISDEIHQDLVFEPFRFVSFGNVAKNHYDFTITLTAATKTFNLAGIKNSMIFVKNKELREALEKQIMQNAQHEINTFGFVGTEAAYRYGGEWLTALLAYLSDNAQLVTNFFAQKLPQVKVMQPEGTYLMWLDFRALNKSSKELDEQLVHKGKVVLNNGSIFGPGGNGFMRLNLACPQKTLEEGLRRIKFALE